MLFRVKEKPNYQSTEVPIALFLVGAMPVSKHAYVMCAKFFVCVSKPDVSSPEPAPGERFVAGGGVSAAGEPDNGEQRGVRNSMRRPTALICSVVCGSECKYVWGGRAV